MKSEKMYYSNIIELLTREKIELEFEIESIKEQLKSKGNPKGEDFKWRMSANIAKKFKCKMLYESIIPSIKRYKGKVHVISQLEAKSLSEDRKKTMNRQKNVNIQASIEIGIKQGRALRDKLIECVGFDEYVKWCRENLEPIQQEIKQKYGAM